MTTNKDIHWETTGINGICRLSVATDIPVGHEMYIAGRAGETTYILGTRGDAGAWISTKGTWKRTITYPDTLDEQLLEAQENPRLLFPENQPQVFTPLEEAVNDLNSLAVDTDANEVSWLWKPEVTVYPEPLEVLSTHTFKYPFKQVTQTRANMACLLVNVNPDDIPTKWNATVVSSDQEDFDIQKEGTDCWYVSIFTDITKADGTNVPRGQFRKMVNPTASLVKTDVPNYVMKLWRV